MGSIGLQIAATKKCFSLGELNWTASHDHCRALTNIGNRTKWSPILSVIIGVINNIRRPRGGSPIMITDRIERHEVLLPINRNYDKI